MGSQGQEDVARPSTALLGALSIPALFYDGSQRVVHANRTLRRLARPAISGVPPTCAQILTHLCGRAESDMVCGLLDQRRSFTVTCHLAQADGRDGRASQGARIKLTGIPCSDAEVKGILLLQPADEPPQARDEDTVVDGLLSIVSHELRSPLAYIAASSELLATGTLPTGESKDLLATISQRSSYLAHLVESILDAEQLRVGLYSAHRDNVDAREIVGAACEHLAGEAATERVRVAAEPEMPPARADRTRSEIIVRNLIRNALTYSPEDTEVTVRVGTDTLGNVTILVTNEGQGIPQEQMLALFSRARRLVSKDNGRPSGHGLGLYIAALLAEAQEGTLMALSEPGRGVTFTYTLPRYDAHCE